MLLRALRERFSTESLQSLRHFLGGITRFTFANKREDDQGGVVSAESSRHSAVLLALCLDKTIPSILFTKRSNKMSQHKGQISFPGGLIEDEDGSGIEGAIKTALRETDEEVGIAAHDIDVLGVHHDAYTLPSLSRKTIITPVVGFIKKDIAELDLALSEDEVAFAFTVPLEQLIRLDHWSTFNDKPCYTHSFTKGGRVVKAWSSSNIPYFHRSADSLSLPPPLPVTSASSVTTPSIAPPFVLTPPASFISPSALQQREVNSSNLPHPSIEDEQLIWGATAWMLYLFIKESRRAVPKGKL